MGLRKREWSFKNEVKKAKKAITGERSLESELADLREWTAEPDANPKYLTSTLESSVGVARWCEALIHADQNSPEAWPIIHLLWRYRALTAAVKMEWEVHAPKADPIDCQDLAQITLALAFAAAVGEDKGAIWLGTETLKLLRQPKSVLLPNALIAGSVPIFLLRLFLLWREMPLAEFPIHSEPYGPFWRVFENWDNPAQLETATWDLCELHAQKALDVHKPNDDFIFGLQSGCYLDYPVEILFLQRVRRDLKLPIPDPSHPIIRSPLIDMPFPCPPSGRDDCIAETYAKCKRMMPYLSIPWEEGTATSK